MTIALSVAVVLLGVLLLLLLGSHIEMYKTVEQLREYSGLVDRPTPLDLPEERTPSRVGLPAELDSAVASVVLLLSNRCSTCRSIAADLSGAINPDLTIVVEPGGVGDDADGIAVVHQLDPERTIIDRDGEISQRLAIKTTPAAIVIENGQFVRASTVPSTRQLNVILSNLRAGRSRAKAA